MCAACVFVMFLFLSVFKCVSSTYSSESVGQLLTNYLPNTIRFDQGDEETWPDKKSKKPIFEVFLAFASYKFCKFFGMVFWYFLRWETWGLDLPAGQTISGWRNTVLFCVHSCTCRTPFRCKHHEGEEDAEKHIPACHVFVKNISALKGEIWERWVFGWHVLAWQCFKVKWGFVDLMERYSF